MLGMTGTKEFVAGGGGGGKNENVQMPKISKKTWTNMSSLSY